MLYLGEHKWVVALRERLGIAKPELFVFGDGSYDDWKTNTRKNYPVGWFLTETLPDWIEAAYKFVTSPYYDTRYYIRNRFIRKSHMLRTDCPPGQYWDTDERILTALANAIIDYVEVELAFKHQWCGSEEVPNAVWRNGRCPGGRQRDNERQRWANRLQLPPHIHQFLGNEPLLKKSLIFSVIPW